MLSPGEGSLMASRAYQREMFEASVDGNVIVVMDTGSGKTRVAILRIKHMLDHDEDQKLIWFLAPTVTLCTQQYHVIRTSIPSAPARLIIGSDNVDRWKSQRIWDNVLSTRIIVSTHQILSDALNHGFVKICRIGLLVFDEAHHCNAEHPGNRIMRDHYFPSLRRDGKHGLPKVLGLTASPIMKSKVRSDHLRVLEQNLDAICKSPRIHRSELSEYVHIPELMPVLFNGTSCSDISQALIGFQAILESLNILEDPDVLKLLEDPADTKKVEQILVSRKTRCQNELRKFLRKAEHTQGQLGPWATDAYIATATAKLQEACAASRSLMLGWENKEKLYVLKILRSIPAQISLDQEQNFQVSSKVHRLIDLLLVLQVSKFSGIIFVDQRATAAMLCKILTLDPRTRHFTCAPFVGTSNNAKRRTELGDLVDSSLQGEIIADFKVGKCDLVVATSVLEEGIDISSCNVVICFDKPQNIKSFIQRRGRARDSKSKFAMMLSRDDSMMKANDWQELEAEMMKTYQEERRQLESALRMEDEEEDYGMRPFVVETEGHRAIITVDRAIGALCHFCGVLTRTEFVNNNPVFTFRVNRMGRLQAVVTLPSSVDPAVRCCSGIQWWLSEKQAKKDAAFQAYIGLYHAGLVNDHLVPSPKLVEKSYFSIKQVPSSTEVSPLWSPWLEQAKAWSKTQNIHVTPVKIRIRRPRKSDLEMLFLCPSKVVWNIPSCQLHWREDEIWLACFSNQDFTMMDGAHDVQQARTTNDLILRSLYHSRMLSDSDGIVTIFAPALRSSEISVWLKQNSGTLHPSVAHSRGPPFGIVRHQTLGHSPQVFQCFTEDGSIEVTSIPRRRNFLRIAEDKPSRKSQVQRRPSKPKVIGLMRPLKRKVLPAEGATFDNLSEDVVTFAVLVPSISHHIGRALVAIEACNTLLSPVGFCDIGLVLEAITASSAGENVNYQRLELIGDSVLKYLVATQLFDTHDKWHEGYLSRAKDSLVANSTLAHAAIEKGLDQFIFTFTTQFSPRRWRPLYIDDLLQSQPPEPRKMSTKIIADVVEGLIGASYVEGGLAQAARCAHVFLNEVQPQPAEPGPPQAHFSAAKMLPPYLNDLQSLIGHTFHTPSLLIEATTHPSSMVDLSTSSYQRLEFLGDAVLDLIMVQHLSKHQPPLSHMSMHLIKSALVNANLLAFLCMDLSMAQEVFEVTSDPETHNPITTLSTRTLRLCDFMATTLSSISLARQTCLSRHQKLRPSIYHALTSSTSRTHPWSSLLSLAAPKFLSDIIESILGAIYLDSPPPIRLANCEVYLEKLGLMSYLRRILKDEIDVLHPKSRLSEIAECKVRFHISQGGNGYICYAQIGETCYPEVSEGMSREEITTRAADAAVQVLIASATEE